MQRNPLKQTPRALRWLPFLLCSAIAVMGALGPAAAGPDPLLRLQPQLAAVKRAIANKDFGEAEKQLISAYINNPHPHLLCWFGRWAARLPSTLPLRPLPLDYFRRCLEASPLPEDAELVAEARAALAHPPSADEQVELQVLASGDELLWVDDHLAGRFPLARPLLLSPGRHLLRRARGSETPLQKELTLSPDQPIYVTSMQGGWDVGFMDLFLVLWAEPEPPAGVERAALWRVIEAALERDNAIAVSQKRARHAQSRDPQQPGCGGVVSCLAELGTKSRVPYVLEVSLTGTAGKSGQPGSLRLTIRAYDVRAEEVSHTQGLELSEGDRAGLERQLTELVRQARRAALRPLAVMEVRSQPAAQLTVDGRERGQTPRTVALVPGPHTLVLRRPDFHELTTQLVLSEGSLPPVELVLSPRPLSRAEKALRVAGPTLTALGLAALAASSAPLLLDGQEVPGSNPLLVLSTRDTGLGLLIGGGVALTTGVVLIAVDRSRKLRLKAPWN